MYKEEVLEWIERRIAGWPVTQRDLLRVKWPAEWEVQSTVAKALSYVTMDTQRDSVNRQIAFDFLMDVARNYEDKVKSSEDPAECVPPALLRWTFLVAIGAIERPPDRAGRPTTALRDRKILAVMTELCHDGGYEETDAISMIAQCLGLAEESIRAALDRTKQDPHTISDPDIDTRLQIYGERIPGIT